MGLYHKIKITFNKLKINLQPDDFIIFKKNKTKAPNKLKISKIN